MDVQCERCKAEYEFDDALISGRGTTVKCTSCGYQFKIRRAVETQEVAPDRWAVQTSDGRSLVFTSLRELQKAILARQVGRSDTLARAGGAARPLESIAELEPFFDEAVQGASGSVAKRLPDGSTAPPRVDTKRPSIGAGGLAPVPPRRSSRPPPPAGGSRPALRPIPVPTPTPPPAGVHPSAPPAMRPRVDTIRPPDAAVPPPPPSTLPRAAASLHDVGALPPPSSSGVNSSDLVPESEAPTARIEHTPPMGMGVPHGPYGTPVQHHSAPPLPARASHHALPNTAPMPAYSAPPPPRQPSTVPMAAFAQPFAASPSAAPRPPPPTIQVEDPQLPPPTVPVRTEPPRIEGAMRGSLASMDEDLSLPGQSRRASGWVVAAVLLVGVGVIGFAVARPYLTPRHEATAAPAAVDPRVQAMLSDGERALVAGDFDLANDSFVRASALAEHDPHVLLDLARLADVRADVPWLKLLVLPTDASSADDQKMTKAQLDDLAGRAKKAAQDAVAAAPTQAPPVLTQINALRMSGDSAGARALVAKVIQGASEPDTAYALAALDLAEPEPLWPMVIERLRLAAAGEGNAGRARAALVYALARSGDTAGAKAELDKLASQTRPYPLLAVLRTFVSKAPASKPDAGAHAVAAGGAVDVNSLPHPPGPAARGGGGGGGGGGNPSYSGPNDPRFLLAQAESAKNSHDYDRARALYSSALAQNSSDSEALAGLGDVNKAMHDLPGAASYYRRALAANPVYLPALVGLGDVEWDSGDKDEAQKTYRDIADRFPEGAYPGRVKQRANDTGSAAPAAATTSNTTASPAASASSGASQ